MSQPSPSELLSRIAILEAALRAERAETREVVRALERRIERIEEQVAYLPASMTEPQ